MASVLVPLAPGCEELEAITIIDLLRRAEIQVTTASLTDEPVKARHGTVIIADTTLDKALQQDYDMVVLPGGLPGADYLQNDQRVQQLLKKMARENKYTAAICAAPKALASAGLLEGKTATCYPGTLEKLQLKNTTISDLPVVTDGLVTTSKGPGTAMDFSLHLIELLVGKSRRDSVEAALQRS